MAENPISQFNINYNSNVRLAALQELVESLNINRGQMLAAVAQFIVAGFDEAALVVAYVVSLKLFANTVAHLTRPAIEAGFRQVLPAL